MGKARRSRPRKRGLSRREFLRRAGAASAVLSAAPILTSCSADGGRSPESGADTVDFKHGVASGDPLSDRVILWTRVTPPVDGPISGMLTVALDPAFAQIVGQTSFSTDVSRDYTVKVDQAGLESGTTYYYRFKVGGTDSPIGRTRTLPVGPVDRLRIGVVVCASLAHGYFNAYQRVAERADLDLVLHLGDYIYEYGTGEYGDVREYEPANEILTLEDYRTRHAQYKREPELIAMHRQHAMIAIWDDHEFADNSWQDGAVNHSPDTEGLWSDRVANALRAYYEWMPVREPVGDGKRDYRSVRFGDLAELTLLEERVLARSQQVEGVASISGASVLFAPIGEVQNSDRQMLGGEQEVWLGDTLRNTPAQWKLIGQGVMFGQLKLLGLPEFIGGGYYVNPDQWDGYPAARQRVFDMLEGDGTQAAIDNVVVLTGDIHCSWCMDLSPDPNNPVPLAGGYDPITGDGSRAVEFVVTAVSSPGLDALEPIRPLIPVLNPHIRYVDLTQKGYMLLDVTPERVVGEHWYVDTVTSRSGGETLGTAYAVVDGSAHLTASEQTVGRDEAPELAP